MEYPKRAPEFLLRSLCSRLTSRQHLVPDRLELAAESGELVVDARVGRVEIGGIGRGRSTPHEQSGVWPQ